jgi:hypothetical protein
MRLVWKSRLLCPKCGKEFIYEYVPGASFTAFRLGGSRYMACPLCHRWSIFNLRETRIREAPEDPH